MTISPRTNIKAEIGGYVDMVKQLLGIGWNGYMVTFMFNRISGGLRHMNYEMQRQIENVYASLVTRMHRRPTDPDVTPPILISCPDYPVAKNNKKPLSEIIINDGLHNNGLLLIAPGPNRLKVSVEQHFSDNKSYYLRDQILNRIDIKAITHNIDHVVDYALKGLKARRMPEDEALLILPKSSREATARPYIGKVES